MTFDGPNKLIVLSAATLDLQTLWAAWKAWLRAGNAQYALALNTVGGEPIDPSAGTLVPLYLFLLNGWKLRPMEADHTLSVVGGTLLVEGGGDPFVSTLGDFTVRIRYQQPVQAIGYSMTGSTGPSASDIAAAVWQRAIENSHTSEQMMRIMFAALAGTSEQAGSTIVFKSADGATSRIISSFDTANNRVGVILDGH